MEIPIAFQSLVDDLFEHLIKNPPTSGTNIWGLLMDFVEDKEYKGDFFACWNKNGYKDIFEEMMSQMVKRLKARVLQIN